MKEYMKKGFLAGVIISLILEAEFILSFFMDFSNILMCFVAALCGIVAFLFLKGDSIKLFLISLLMLLIGFILGEIIITYLPIAKIFFHIRYPNADEFSLGDGLMFAVFSIRDGIGVLIGCFAAFVVMTVKLYRQRLHQKTHNNQ